MKKIVIIGAGQLGSRHLQGIAQCSFDVSIEVVEPYKGARDIAFDRYKEIKESGFVKDISFYDSIESLSDEIDLVIVATNSNIRAIVTKKLLETKKVKNLVLEKVLFQRVDEYYMIEKLLEEKGVNCWVNHPRRMFPFYQELKEMFNGATQLSYNFSGGKWGLACNGLHFIDHLAYLTNSLNITLNNEFLDKKIYPSNRDGFIELNGLLVGKLDNHHFSLYSNRDEAPFIFTISSDRVVIKIYEDMGRVEIAKKSNKWRWEQIDKKIVYYQSELSQIMAKDIIINNKTTLPTYKEAMGLHIPFIESMLKHINSIDNKENNNICPIT